MQGKVASAHPRHTAAGRCGPAMPPLARRFVRRLMHLLAVLAIVSVATFLMLELLPGNLADSFLHENASEAEVAAIERDLGLDKPLVERFMDWAGNALRGDLGESPVSGEPISAAIAERLPVTLQLLLYAQLLSLAIALPLGILAGYREGSTLDRVISGGALGSLAMPHFVWGILLILLLSIWLDWLPATGYVPFLESPPGNLMSLFLPALTLAMVEAPVYLRLLRSDVASTLREDYIVVARAKGLGDRQILLRHALRPSSFTLITLMGINIGNLIGGSVIVESLFALPGVGRYLVEGVIRRDFFTVQGVVLVIAVAFVLVNLLVDLAYNLLDPRLSHDSAH
ncbi:ABC transporter permease [Marinobacter sp. OP 3.4]|uniref:ABC transporter permease n=1 Tax=Marinobacter sp. OP 3.4 TaxID=3076501 RepID=UPI002E232F66